MRIQELEQESSKILEILNGLSVGIGERDRMGG